MARDTGRAYQQLFRHGFRRLDAERAHHLGFAAVRAAGPVLRWRRPVGTPVEALGLRFPHPLGLAAGFDKNGVGIDALGALGFGHVESGTVTGQAQPGNPRPRLFRLVEDHAVVNRMGFNNEGAAAVAARLAARGRPAGAPVLGINIGKTKVVPEDDEAAVLADYGVSARLLAPHADYLVVNVSSPNTTGLRSLQAVERLEPLLEHVRATADAAAARHVPLLVKIAPDLADEDVVDVAAMARRIGLDGLIATNTTIARDGLRSAPAEVERIGAGGLSGRPLTHRATEVLRLVRAEVGADLVLIGVGGITTPEEARERLAAGATLVQGYTAFIYEGPGWPRRVAAGLA
ncbi:quinone-dependent dihydroorotate dehydrogenase [Nocardioides sp.]|uniref:quinone-dependent dihydroorotate dehydrogenase n=1 Tax=Nocardioides sp. TaxID=35761 RepID=UPI0035119E6B